MMSAYAAHETNDWPVARFPDRAQAHRLIDSCGGWIAGGAR